MNEWVTHGSLLMRPSNEVLGKDQRQSWPLIAAGNMVPWAMLEGPPGSPPTHTPSGQIVVLPRSCVLAGRTRQTETPSETEASTKIQLPLKTRRVALTIGVLAAAGTDFCWTMTRFAGEMLIKP